MLKPVKDFEGLYVVNEEGTIRSIERNGTSKGGRILKHSTDSYGYSVVKMRNKKIVKTKKVHRVVAEAFIENPENKEQVNHIDGNKKNNHVSNLEWNNPVENIKHMLKLGLYKGDFGRVKVDKVDPKNMKVLETYNSLKEAGEKNNLMWQNISQVIRGQRFKSGGYHWKRSTTIPKGSTLEA